MKIKLTNDQGNAIDKLIANGGAGVEALKELFNQAIAELSDIRNIDPKGNMGLQSLASQKALEIIDEIQHLTFPKESNKKNLGGVVIDDQPRRYQ